MNLTVSTERAESVRMPLHHYIVGVAVNELADEHGWCSIRTLADELRAKYEDIEDILLEYFDVFELNSAGSVRLIPGSSHMFDEDDGPSMAKDVITMFNQINGTSYRHKTYKRQIDTISRSDRKITIESFEAVIRHKAIVWGGDEKMAEYNRPSTLFRSAAKFAIYLDEARIYWDREYKKSKSWH